MRKGFGNVPQVYARRSKFDLSSTKKTAFSMGQLIPLDVKEVLPGDSFKVDLSTVIRTSTSFIKPIMDNIYMDVFFFFVPDRLCFEDAEKVYGNATPSAYVDNDLAEYPTNSASGTVVQGSLGDFFDLPYGEYVQDTINIMDFRNYALIYNTWFRNENVNDEVYIQKGNGNGETFNANPFSANNYMGMPALVTKKKDYFTSCLPQPQKGEPVRLSLGQTAPIVPNMDNISLAGQSEKGNLAWAMNSSGVNEQFEISVSTDSSPLIGLAGDNPLPSTGVRIDPRALIGGQYLSLWDADLSSVEGTSINDLRYALALQSQLERDSLYGSRYNEYLLSAFGVVSPDSRIQLPEYLGGGRIPINVQQVSQTSQSSETSSLGDVGAFSLTNGKCRFNKGFTEHGKIYTLACIRQFHTYSQGIPRRFLKKSRNDIYDPLFAHIGEQPIYKEELFSNGFDGQLTTFGYNEAWADYRNAQSRVNSNMRPEATDSLDVWHLGDDYANAPSLTSDFINETPIYLDRALAVSSNDYPQFIVDCFFKTEAIRVMPTYSVPSKLGMV